MKFVKESIHDVLKPKEIKGKLFYLKSSFVSWPVFVVEILGVEKAQRPFSGELILHCKVVFNDRMIEGTNYFDLDSGGTFFLDSEDFEYHKFQELDYEPLAVMDQEIEKIQLKRNYFERLINGN